MYPVCCKEELLKWYHCPYKSTLCIPRTAPIEKDDKPVCKHQSPYIEGWYTQVFIHQSPYREGRQIPLYIQNCAGCYQAFSFCLAKMFCFPDCVFLLIFLETHYEGRCLYQVYWPCSLLFAILLILHRVVLWSYIYNSPALRHKQNAVRVHYFILIFQMNEGTPTWSISFM